MCMRGAHRLQVKHITRNQASRAADTRWLRPGVASERRARAGGARTLGDPFEYGLAGGVTAVDLRTAFPYACDVTPPTLGLLHRPAIPPLEYRDGDDGAIREHRVEGPRAHVEACPGAADPGTLVSKVLEACSRRTGLWAGGRAATCARECRRAPGAALSVSV